MNLTAGIYDPPGTESAHDLIIRNNHFRNVGFGIYYKDRGWPVNRILIHDNVIDVGSAFTGPAGIRLLSATGSQFSALIIRKNIIRNAVWDVSQDITGVHVSGGIDLNIENNLINNTSTGTGGTGVIPAAFTAMRIFNNRNTTGQLVYPDTP